MADLRGKARRLAERIRRLVVGQFVILTLVVAAIVVPLGWRVETGRAGLIARQTYEDSIIASSRTGADSSAEVRIQRGIIPTDSASKANLIKSMMGDLARANTEVGELNSEETVDSVYGLFALLITAAWVITAWIWFGRKVARA